MREAFPTKCMQSKIQGCLYIMLHIPCQMQEMHKGKTIHMLQRSSHTQSSQTTGSSRGGKKGSTPLAKEQRSTKLTSSPLDFVVATSHLVGFISSGLPFYYLKSKHPFSKRWYLNHAFHQMLIPKICITFNMLVCCYTIYICVHFNVWAPYEIHKLLKASCS
jgi:hypothetical protein